jgi:ubiquinone/menaquinone biosynthesis C-methylase UbiE
MGTDRDTRLMKAYWDDKARENATYYVSSYQPYDDQNLEEFWKWGDILAERFLGESGIAFSGKETMLEIGCGVGRMTRYFARRFAEVRGVDVAGEMIARAKENLSDCDNVALHVGNGHDLSGFDDSRFDFVFSYITFQHIPAVPITLEYIRESGRVLKTGGHFYFQVNNMPAGVRSRLRLRSRFRSILGRSRGGAESPGDAGDGPRGLDHPAWLGSRVSVAQIERACRSGNLKILDMHGEGTQYLWVKAVKQ